MRQGVIARMTGFFLALSAIPVCSAAPEPVAVPELSAEQVLTLVPELRQGGHILFFRHAATRRDQVDQRPLNLADCATQRNLSEEGRKQSQAIGVAFRRLGIPVGSVLTSPFCRTRDTAQLAFAQGEVLGDLYFAMGLSKPERQKKGAELRQLLAQTPPAGQNQILVGHTANLEEAIGLWPKPEGVAIVFRPDGRGGWGILGRVRPEIWLRAASQASGSN